MGTSVPPQQPPELDLLPAEEASWLRAQGAFSSWLTAAGARGGHQHVGRLE